MKDLVIMNEQQAVTTSLKIAEVFGKRHDHVLRDIETYEKDAPNFGEMFFETKTLDSYNRERKTYLMNRDGYSLLAMSFTGKKALEFKLKYIEAFNEMEKQLSIQAPTNMIEALTLALEQQKTIASQNKEIELLQPKALFADSVASSHTSILIGDLAKLLRQNGYEIGQNRLFEKLRYEGFLIKRKGSSYNMPTQRSMNMDLIEIKETTFTNADGSTRITKTPKITGKGQIYFINKYLGE